jgi:flavin-dependent dehydrogenase
MKAGELVLERLFPGLIGELEARGSIRVRFARDIHWFHHNAWASDGPADLTVQTQTRPLLEDAIRVRLVSEGAVKLLGATVRGLAFDANRSRVVGVEVWADRRQSEMLAADVVVDASGRGSRLPEWLAAAGYERPPEECVHIDLWYASRLYRTPPDAGGSRAWKALLVSPKAPDQTRGGTITPVEGNQWLVTLFGYLGDEPPTDPAGFMEFARSLPVPDLAEALEAAEPISDIQRYRFTNSRWRHYERLRRLPAGLAIVGDAVCSFDPVFAQGMTVAALAADTLGRVIATDPMLARPQRYFGAVARELALPWWLAASEDLRYPRAAGRRPFWLPWVQSYTNHLFALIAFDAEAYRLFLEAMHMLAGPEVMLHPRLVLRVLRHALHRRRDTIARITGEVIENEAWPRSSAASRGNRPHGAGALGFRGRTG